MKTTLTKNKSAIEMLEMEKQQRSSEINLNQLQNIFQNVPGATAVYEGHEHKYILANKAYEKLVNRKAADLLGRSFRDVFPELKGTGTFELYDTVFESKEPFHALEYAAMVDIKNDGVLKQGYFNFSMEPLKNDSGEVYAILTMTYDITEQVEARKKIEEIDKQFQNVLLHSPNIFIILEGFPEMIITFANEPLYKSWGKTAAIIGKPLMEVVPEIKDQTFPALLQQVFETGKTHYSSEERAVIHINGNPFDKYYNYVYQPILNDDQKVTGVTVMATDITELVFSRKKVEESETLFRLALFLTAKTVFKQDIELKYTWIYNTHPSFEMKNLLGKTDREILNYDSAEILTTIKQTVLNTGSTFAGDIELEIDGKAGVFALKVEATKDSAGKINGIIAVSDDITDQKQASQYARSLIEASLDPLVTISANGKITDVNEASIKVTGVEREKLIDTDFSNYFTEPEKAQEGYQQVFEKGFVTDYPLTIKNKNGNLTDVLYNASVYKDDKGRVLGVFAAARDVTERKMFEKELIGAKEFAENAAKSKQQFLSNMSHEIRTPLNSIIGFTNVLLKTALGSEQKEFLEAISTSGKSLNLLINDILDLAKVDAGKMTFEKHPIEIRKSITSILHSFDMKIKEKNLELAVEHDSKAPSVLLGDSLRLNQIFFNLISNAVKFTHKGKIKLHIKLLNEDKENVTIEFVVSDSGIGIPDNKLNSIFNLFEQAEHSTSTSYGGTGLGLSIVKQLVEGQGGSVNVKSKLGEGSAFSFILPFGKANLKLEEEIILLKPVSEIINLRVLVAEDVALNQLLIKMILNDFGFEHEIVGNGKLAIEKMQTNTYDIILMDLQMPEMNGYETTEYIRKILKSHIPIIALTADVTTMDVSKCKEFGMDDYISKPITENLLYSKMVELVKRKR